MTEILAPAGRGVVVNVRRKGRRERRVRGNDDARHGRREDIVWGLREADGNKADVLVEVNGVEQDGKGVGERWALVLLLVCSLSHISN